MEFLGVRTISGPAMLYSIMFYVENEVWDLPLLYTF